MLRIVFVFVDLFDLSHVSFYRFEDFFHKYADIVSSSVKIIKILYRVINSNIDILYRLIDKF